MTKRQVFLNRVGPRLFLPPPSVALPDACMELLEVEHQFWQISNVDTNTCVPTVTASQESVKNSQAIPRNASGKAKRKNLQNKTCRAFSKTFRISRNAWSPSFRERQQLLQLWQRRRPCHQNKCLWRRELPAGWKGEVGSRGPANSMKQIMPSSL